MSVNLTSKEHQEAIDYLKVIQSILRPMMLILKCSYSELLKIDEQHELFKWISEHREEISKLSEKGREELVVEFIDSRGIQNEMENERLKTLRAFLERHGVPPGLTVEQLGIPDGFDINWEKVPGCTENNQ